MRGICFRRQFSFLSLFLILTFASSCSTQRKLTNEPEEEYRTLPGHFAKEEVTEPLVAVEAYIGKTDFFISYESADGLVYSGGNWSNRIDITAVEQSADGAYAGPYILPLEYQQRERWMEIPESLIIPRLLSSKLWIRFVERLFDSILPKAEKTGIVMHFDDDDYFLYNNINNNFESRLIIDKPDDYTISESIAFEDFVHRSMPLLKEFLAEEAVTERRVVFSTGDAGP